MTQPSKPKEEQVAPSDPIGRLLALMDEWMKEPDEDDDATVAALDRAHVEEPIRFHEPDGSAGARKDEVGP